MSTINGIAAIQSFDDRILTCKRIIGWYGNPAIYRAIVIMDSPDPFIIEDPTAGIVRPGRNIVIENLRCISPVDTDFIFSEQLAIDPTFPSPSYRDIHRFSLPVGGAIDQFKLTCGLNYKLVLTTPGANAVNPIYIYLEYGLPVAVALRGVN